MALPIEDYVISSDVEIWFMPFGNRKKNDGVETEHVQELLFHPNVDGGTFRLRVNGEQTADITFNTTVATFLTSINNALDALEILDAAEIVATGTASTAITLTGADPGYYHILVENVALTDSSVAVEPSLAVRTRVTTYGSLSIRLDAYMSSFDIEDSVDTTDTTPISQFSADVVAVKNSGSFSAKLFDANQEWGWLFAVMDVEGLEGRMEVYKQGKFDGTRYRVLDVLIESAKQSYPDHDKLEIDISGMRKGAYVVPPESIYRI
jgi:hypothetical protein